MKSVGLSLFMALLFLSFFASAAGRSTKLNLPACHAAPSNLLRADASLAGPHANTYRPFLVVCPIYDPHGTKVLQILALRADKAFAAHKLYFIHGKPWNGIDGPALNDADPIPRPVILTLAGKAIGVLQDFLFSEGAGMPSVTFIDWNHHRPQRILFRMDDAGVLGSYCPPPLVWNTKVGRYIEQPGPRTQVCANR